MGLRDGDATLFEEFVHQETRTFLGFFRRQGAGTDEAEDLVQELFLKLYRHATNYSPQERFPAFAFRIARNAWIDRQRRRSSRPGHLSLDQRGRGAEAEERSGLAERLEDPAEQVHERLSVVEQADRLRRALAELPDHHRSVFELGVLQELGYAEIGAILDIPVGTVKSRMFHAVRRLRAAMGDEAATAPGGAAETAREGGRG